jgi:hypothetical protein
MARRDYNGEFTMAKSHTKLDIANQHYTAI